MNTMPILGHSHVRPVVSFMLAILQQVRLKLHMQKDFLSLKLKYTRLWVQEEERQP
jgi:hypothetical protein